MTDIESKEETAPEPINHYLDKINAWEKELHFWYIQSIIKNEQNITLVVKQNILSMDLQDLFDDERIGSAVQAGSKIPSKDDFWQVLYKKETKLLQQLFNPEKIWVTQTPQSPYTIIWSKDGTRINKPKKPKHKNKK